MSNAQTPWWATRFQLLADVDPAFAGTVDLYAEAQVDRIERLAGLQPGDRVLDIGCGAGRHCTLLQERGYKATGVELSEHLIALAEEQWARRHPGQPGPRFVQGDMRDPPPSGPFDVVLFMDESLGVFEEEADHLETLAAASARLRDGGRLILELFNPYFWAQRNLTRHYPPGALAKESDLIRTYRFDPVRGRVLDRIVVFRDGQRVELPTQSLRAWTPTEILAMVRAAGFADARVHGTDGWDVPPDGMALDATRSAFMWVVATL